MVRHGNSDGAFVVLPIHVNAMEISVPPIYSDAGIFFFSVSIKCNASFLDLYYTPKSSTTKINIVSSIACLKVPVVKPAWV